MTQLPATRGPDETLRVAPKEMKGSNCASLPVTAGEGSRRLVGMVTDNGIRMADQPRGRSLKKLQVRDATPREVRVCDPGGGLF